MSKHTWKFFRVGGFDQVQIRSGADIEHLAELDPKLWVAIACPTKSIELDRHTLELLDSGGDGRIRVPDVLEMASWLCRVLADPDELLEGREELPIASIDELDEEGKRLRASARQILRNLGKEHADAISPADTRDTAAIFASTLFNGDGVVPAESAEEDEATAQAIRDVMACCGAEKDASGKDGVSQARVDAFFADAKVLVDWWHAAEGDAAIFPLGEATPAAWSAYAAVREKVDDYFTRCALAAMDERAATALNPGENELSALNHASLSPSSEAVASLPIARAGAGRPLPLGEGINPAFRARIAALRADCVKPILGADRDALSEDEWRAIEEKLAGHAAWLAKKPPSQVESLGIARLTELVRSDAKAKIDALIARDLALEAEAKAIAAVDKLVHGYRDFATLLRNFVSFEDFYSRRGKATFQAGVLYLDGRSFDLCMRVEDAAKHATLAGLSMACLAYCDCTRGTETMTIVAAITNGDSDFLVVGRNGVFYDRAGNDWDATVTKVVEQPISIRQAFWSPYKKLARFVSEQIEKLAGEKDAESDSLLKSAVPPALPSGDAAAAPAGAASGGAAAPAFDVAKFAGIFAAIGLAIGAIGSAVAAVVSGFLDLALWQMPLAVAGALLVISGPSMLLAALKLRQRNLGPLLDASGWAINTRARINIPFGEALTHVARLPAGASRSVTDPYADKKSRWKTWLVIAALLGGGTYLARDEIRAWLRPHIGEWPVVGDWVAEPATTEAVEEVSEPR